MAQTTSATVPSRFITLKYLGAALSATLAVMTSIAAIWKLIGLWSGSGLSTSPLAGPLGLIGISSDLIAVSIAAVIFSVLAFFLYRWATKAIAGRVSYLETTPYRVITNGFVAVMAMIAVLLTVDVLTVLISSLLLIGKSVDIGHIYLTQFLPSLVGLAVAGFAALMGYQIAKGRNKSFLLTLVTMSLAGAILVAVCITVPINKNYTAGVPLKSSSSSSSDKQFDLDDWLPDSSTKNKNNYRSDSGSGLYNDYDDFDFDY